MSKPMRLVKAPRETPIDPVRLREVILDLERPRLRRRHLKPGMRVKNTASGLTATVLAHPKNPERLARAHRDYVQVWYHQKNGVAAGVKRTLAWHLPNLRVVG